MSDTSRICCDGRCFQGNPSQGGSCPLMPRQHYRPERRTSPAIAWFLVSLGCIALCAVIVDGLALGGML